MGIPANVVEMQMSAQNNVHCFGSYTHRLQIVEILGFQIAEDLKLPLPVSPNASIHDNDLATRFEDEPLKVDEHLALGCRVVRLQPGELQGHLSSAPLQQKGELVIDVDELCDAKYFDRSDFPFTNMLHGHVNSPARAE